MSEFNPTFVALNASHHREAVPDNRCLAAVALDPGGYQAPLTSLGLQKPSLTMHNANNQDYTLFARATTNAYWFQIQYTQHSSSRLAVVSPGIDPDPS